MAPSSAADSGICSMIRHPPIKAATMKPRANSAPSSSRSPAPSACAVNASVLMRRKPNSQNRQSKITEAIATPPSSAGSPSRPMAIVETMPINGVVRFATIAGPAMAKTCADVTLAGEFTKGAKRLPAARRAEDPRQHENRDHDDGAEQEVAPQPVDGIEAEIPQPLYQQPDAVDDIPGIEADRGEHHADQDRQQDQPERHRQRGAAEKARQAVIGRRQFPGVVRHRRLPAADRSASL